MQKLTKEQRDWLIEKLECSYVGKDSYPAIREIINQYTEKEFPTFTITDRYNKDITASFAPIYKCILLSKIDLEVGEEWILTIEQFKAFTKGCVAITKFLEEENE